MAPTTGKPELGLAELHQPCRFRGVQCHNSISLHTFVPARLAVLAGSAGARSPVVWLAPGAGPSLPFCLALCRGGTGSSAGQRSWQHIGGEL